MPATFATATHTGLIRKTNEDALFARDPVFVVADGMGGAQAGEVASAMAIQAFDEFVPGNGATEEALAKLITNISLEIHKLAVADRAHAGMGTTLTAAIVDGNRVVLAHVGDSRAYLWRGDSLSQLTEDHSLVGEMLRSGQITSAEAEEHPQRSIITRALGVDSEIEIDSRSVEWQPGDVFLLCSDGLYSMVSDADIAAVMAQGGDLGSRAGELVEAANAAGGRDNISVVLFSPDGAAAAGGMDDPRSESGRIDPASAGAGFATSPAVKRRGLLSRLRSFLSTWYGDVTIALLLVAFLLTGGWLISRQVYYLGVNGDRVAIYQGIPYDLGPFSLSNLYRASTVKYSDLQPYEQERVSKQELQSKSSAETMLSNFTTEDNKRRQAEEEAARTQTTAKTPTIPSGGAP